MSLVAILLNLLELVRLINRVNENGPRLLRAGLHTNDVRLEIGFAGSHVTVKGRHLSSQITRQGVFGAKDGVRIVASGGHRQPSDKTTKWVTVAGGGAEMLRQTTVPSTIFPPVPDGPGLAEMPAVTHS